MKGIFTSLLVLFSLILYAQDFDTELNKANSKFFEKKYKEALHDYQKLVESGIGDRMQKSWAYGYIGVCQQELGNIEEAKTNYRKAMEMGTPGPSFYSKCLAIYKSEKNIEGQEFVLLAKKVNMPHEYRKAVKSLSYLYMNSKQFEKLLPVCEELIAWYPTNHKYHYFKAVAHQKLKDLESAKTEYRKAIELKPSDASSNMNLGMILFLKANAGYDKAVKSYESLAKPSDDDYQKCKQKLAVYRKKMREAEPMLLIAYKAKPNKNLKNALYNLYKKCNDFETAKQYQ
ncbi:tetratricopeptide repeat protein [Marinifilum caeruleilacunae]|uniref:Tetratricopeptide repeat protein n=1 Tax=Marinifilum caeruleilacunae TaxID=2499076 RepID=A0ABX1WUP2_9BACT|nr:tetratricopeptide repeat protein [Marinifilum caeruleilacunae]NOU59777.1 tetratricopeptide repeat protein [Marinifilum caeruleilacunae]